MSEQGTVAPSLLTLAADVLHLAYDEGVPDHVGADLRRIALLIRNEHDRGRRPQRLGPYRTRTVKVCPACGTDCPTCNARHDPQPDPHPVDYTTTRRSLAPTDSHQPFPTDGDART